MLVEKTIEALSKLADYLVTGVILTTVILCLLGIVVIFWVSVGGMILLDFGFRILKYCMDRFRVDKEEPTLEERRKEEYYE